MIFNKKHPATEFGSLNMWRARFPCRSLRQAQGTAGKSYPMGYSFLETA
ncbi:Uncharacterized protein dnm_035210 [Desulfonema magnum]|uniref:Uncharacterized protein n=1 Tax=Desulfonema magnum TaxID=45655 RepID=A0A975BKZ6_9BACT|nr:Uncharacterized protein dnm_035210 [Desulfonema magnum]